jgi:hypothetical protein
MTNAVFEISVMSTTKHLRSQVWIHPVGVPAVAKVISSDDNRLLGSHRALHIIIGVWRILARGRLLPPGWMHMGMVTGPLLY